ncbi:MAG: putative toxin-antitoxin system toxin component, PIN family [Deltaproteobacteria bacterium]|nr:putative toxin-antitoxin system toxin component, PIN family [Deltaproteobacteria bacterium]
MKIVLDTDVLVSGMLNPSGPPGRIVDFLRTDVVQLVVDDRIVAEYSDVLRRDYFLKYFSRSDSEDIIDYLSKNSHYSSSSVVIHNMPDEGDAPFLEMAITEDVPLVTGNLKHFPEKLRKGCTVLSPMQFLKRYF